MIQSRLIHAHEPAPSSEHILVDLLVVALTCVKIFLVADAGLRVECRLSRQKAEDGSSVSLTCLCEHLGQSPPLSLSGAPLALSVCLSLSRSLSRWSTLRQSSQRCSGPFSFLRGLRQTASFMGPRLSRLRSVRFWHPKAQSPASGVSNPGINSHGRTRNLENLEALDERVIADA